jgi:dTDP-4-dehydrorhamnose 3,5-epimerase
MSDELRLDETAAAAARDQATVTAAGRSLATSIQDVVTVVPVNHVDHRGRVFEVYAGAPDAFWKDPVVYCYTFTVRPKQTKGWGLHEHKDDRYTLITGEVLTVLYDARVDSSTHGLIQKVHLTGEGVRQLLIPRGVWHMNINLSTQESYLINHPTQVYEHGKPDRLLLPWNSDAIPFDVNSLFPNQQRAH